MTQYHILTTPKENLKDEEAVRARIAQDRPEARIEAIASRDNAWWVRLAEGPPPFPPKKEEGEAPSEEAPKNLEEATDGEEKPKEEGEEKSEKGKDKSDDGEGDALGKLKTLVGEMQSLFDELVNKGQEVADDAKAKSDKIKEIHDTVKEDVADTPGEVGPVPGGPPMPGMEGEGAPPAVPQGPRPAKGLDKRKRPGGGGLSTFTNRRTFIATHSGVDGEGNRISMVDAARELEENEEWSAYKVVNIKAEDDKYVAKLQLREEQ